MRAESLIWLKLESTIEINLDYLKEYPGNLILMEVTQPPTQVPDFPVCSSLRKAQAQYLIIELDTATTAGAKSL